MSDAPDIIKIHHLRPAPGAKTAKTRVGRGEGGKGGKTAGRGTKGTKARKNVPAAFEGGQMPLHMRLPKLKGFRNRFRTEYQVVNVGDLARLFPEGGTVGPDELVAAGAVRRKQLVKVLGDGELAGVALTVSAHAFSGSAREKIIGRRRVRQPALTSDPGRGAAGAGHSAGPAAVPGHHYQEDPRVLSAFRSALATPDLRKKILFTLGIVAVYRLGATIPSPGVSYPNVQECIRQVEGGENSSVYSLINLFSGGALLQLSIFALGIMPYITASIIVQLLTVVIPRFEQLKKEGQSGQSKLTQYTRYLTIALAILQATGIVALADRGQLFGDCSLPVIPDSSIFSLAIIVITMTAGYRGHHVAG